MIIYRFPLQEIQDIVENITADQESYTIEILTVGYYTYIGRASIGSSVYSAVWQIKRLDESSGITILWADGNTNYDNVWHNAQSLNYS
jgi:hypothetical protein